MNARLTTALAVTAAGVLGAAIGHCRGQRSGMAIGYAYGDRDGRTRPAESAAAERPSTLAQHYARNAAQIPGAEDSAVVRDAVRMDLVRRSVHGRERWS